MAWGVDYGFHTISSNSLYGQKVFKVPRMPEPMIVTRNANDWAMFGPSLMDYDEVYHDPSRIGVRTRGQDREIENLKNEIKMRDSVALSKKEEEKRKLDELIAYYYNAKTAHA